MATQARSLLSSSRSLDLETTMAKALGPTQVSLSYTFDPHLSPKGWVNFTVPLSIRVTLYHVCLSASEQYSAGGLGRATHPVL